MWPVEYRRFLVEWRGYCLTCGELRWALGLDSPRALELYAAEAVLAARVRGVTPFAYDKMGELLPLIRQGTAALLADPDLPPEYRGGGS
ncbi:hypothetical protein ACLBX9_16015 [Methylobacterium sp. A49B]